MRVVIVEDEAPIREGLAKILNKINPEYELVGKAADGEEGYKLIVSTNPDLVILDIQMPKMDGLTMLGKLREENYRCKVLVLSAYSDFNYAKQAIELGIENYLLKPIKIRELKKALQQIETVLEKEQSQEQVFSVNSIFLGCLNGQIVPDKQFHMMTKEKYDFTVEDPAEILMLWLGDGYAKQKEIARDLLDDVGAHTVKYSSCVLESEVWQTLIMVLYRFPEDDSQYEYFKHSVAPMLCGNLKSPVVCIWRRAKKLLDLSWIIKEMHNEREWSLLWKKGTLISKEKIEALTPAPFKYPAELEDKVCKAAKTGDNKGVYDGYRLLYTYCQQEPYRPEEIKETVIRFSWAVANAHRSLQGDVAEIRIQNIFSEISEAVSWEKIRRSLEAFFEIINFTFEKEEEIPASVLIQKAKQLIKKFYDQGVTLEEIAEKMFVSEEYLSAQFKKETGVTFSETIRKYRIEKVKELLIDTHLKLNQIAELAGYSDPKYMSKVFKEEVGMLPNEFRKSVH